jgi:hypothetical protein
MLKPCIRIARFAVELAVILSTTAGLAAAQVPAIAAGTRVRVDAPGPTVRLTGTVRSQSADSIAIETTEATRTVPLASVRRVDVSAGVSSRDGAIRGMKIGGLALGGTAAALLLAAYVVSPTNNCAGDMCYFPLYLVPAVVTVGGLSGVVIGSVVGAEHWDTVYPAPVRVSIRPAGNGVVSIGLTLSR